MFRHGSFTLFRVRQVPVRIHWTLLLVLPYLALVFAHQLAAIARAAGVAPERLSLSPFVWGLIAAVGLFASVTLHELAHTLVAARTGGHVRAITLMMLGGVSEIDRPPTRPRDEAWMAAVGPATSLALAALLLAVQHLVGNADVRVGLYYLGSLNLILGVFNLLPAFPMDGGRILRGALAGRLGLARATRIAARVGKMTAAVLFVGGLFAGNFMLVLIALFVHTGADLEARSVELRARLEGVRLGDIMAAPPPAIAITATAGDALARMHRLVRTDLIVVDPHGQVVGILAAEDVSVADPAMTLDEVRAPFGERFVIAAEQEPVNDALPRAEARKYFVVTDQAGGVVGLVGPREVENAIALRATRPPRLGARWRPAAS